jgi:uncharacterized Zn-finger protein
MACILLDFCTHTVLSNGSPLMSAVVSSHCLPYAPGTLPANAENRYTVHRADLPLACPMPGMSLWNSHPKVYLAIEASGSAKCPYCGAQYTLID